MAPKSLFIGHCLQPPHHRLISTTTGVLDGVTGVCLFHDDVRLLFLTFCKSCADREEVRASVNAEGHPVFLRGGSTCPELNPGGQCMYPTKVQEGLPLTLA